jgi:hypothetical protein
MKSPHPTRTLVFAVLASCIASFTYGSVQVTEIPMEAPTRADDAWRLVLGINGWGPAIDTTLSYGIEVDLGLDEILDNLRMAAMLTIAAEKGPWTIGTDLLYLDLGTSDVATVTGDPILGNFTLAGTARVDVDIRAWILTPSVGYRVAEGDWGTVNAIGGARYLHLREQAGLFVNGTLALNGTPLLTKGGYLGTLNKEPFWAALIGVEGHLELPDDWYIPYYLDLGYGEDFTWQAFVGIGRRFEHFDLILGYRHLDFQFNSNTGMDELTVGGPMLGLEMTF